MTLTQDQIDFLEGKTPAGRFDVWYPLMVAGYVVPKDVPPPMFLVTKKGHEALTAAKAKGEGDVHAKEALRLRKDGRP